MVLASYWLVVNPLGAVNSYIWCVVVYIVQVLTWLASIAYHRLSSMPGVKITSPQGPCYRALHSLSKPEDEQAVPGQYWNFTSTERHVGSRSWFSPADLGGLAFCLGWSFPQQLFNTSLSTDFSPMHRGSVCALITEIIETFLKVTHHPVFVQSSSILAGKQTPRVSRLLAWQPRLGFSGSAETVVCTADLHRQTLGMFGTKG